MNEDASKLSDAFTDKLLSGRYRIVESLGVGGMGVVYRAEDLDMGRNVAIKVIKDTSTDAKHVRRMTNEAAALAALSQPNIVTIHSSNFTDADGSYLVMELIEGETIDKLVKRQGPLPPDVVSKLSTEVAEALAHAHAKGIFHRDLKPQNLMLTNGNQIKIMDFGIAKLVGITDQRLTQTGEILGTPLFMSPEQCTNATIDARSDIYSLGCTMYFMLAGKPPFEGDSAMELLMKHASDSPDLSALSDPRLKAIVAKCMQKSPEHRFDSAKALADCLSGQTTVDRLAPAKKLASRKIARFALPAAFGCAIVLVVLFTSNSGQFQTAQMASSSSTEPLQELRRLHDKVGYMQITAKDVAELDELSEFVERRNDPELRIQYEKDMVSASGMLQNWQKLDEHLPLCVNAYERAGGFNQGALRKYVDRLLLNKYYATAEKVLNHQRARLVSKGQNRQARVVSLYLGCVFIESNQREKLDTLSNELSKNAEASDFQLISSIESAQEQEPSVPTCTGVDYLRLPYTIAFPGFRVSAHRLWALDCQLAQQPKAAILACSHGIAEAEIGIRNPAISKSQRDRCKAELIRLKKLQEDIRSRNNK